MIAPDVLFPAYRGQANYGVHYMYLRDLLAAVELQALAGGGVPYHGAGVVIPDDDMGDDE